jgi:hypothetical protein
VRIPSAARDEKAGSAGYSLPITLIRRVSARTVAIDVGMKRGRMKQIKSRIEMEPEEYRAVMVKFHEQLSFVKSIKFKSELVPPDMDCYHGNKLMSCDSQNCMVDSGRAAGMGRFVKD